MSVNKTKHQVKMSTLCPETRFCTELCPCVKCMTYKAEYSVLLKSDCNCSEQQELVCILQACPRNEQSTLNGAKIEFKSGAIRTSAANEVDPEAAWSVLVVDCYNEYMFECSFLPNGERRNEDNWQKGIPDDSLAKSFVRHAHDVWYIMRKHKARHTFLRACCGVLFNCMGLLHNYLKEHPEELAALKASNRKRCAP